MHRYINDNVPIIIKQIYTVNQQLHNYNTRNRNIPHLYDIKNYQYMKSFLQEGPKMWIQLPNDLKNIDKQHIFIKKLKRYLLQNND